MGCGSSTEAQDPEAKTRVLHRKPNWKKIQAALVVDRTEESKAKRADIFKRFDVNGNGYLSLAEVDKGLRDILNLDDIFDAKPVIIRAFNAAKGLGTKEGVESKGNDYVTQPEFRMLLVYLSEYMKIWEIFATADDSDDRRLNKQEFAKTFDALKRWAPDHTLDQCWTEINTSGSLILFTEFAEWAINKQLHTIVENAHDQ